MPEKTLYSNSWYRVASLKPFVRNHAEIHRQDYRGKVWYVLEDHASGRFHRFTEETYFIIGLMNGKWTLQQIWEAACRNLGEDMPTQDELIALVSQLHQADVLQTDISPDIGNLHRRQQKDRQTRFWNAVRSPLAMRLPLLDPDRFLEKTMRITRPFFTLPAGVLWLAIVVSAVFLAITHWQDLTANLADRVLLLENLFTFWLIYPVVKTFHEFGHAYAVKRWGGEVHEMGVMFIVFMPIPYVDASAATAFPDKWQRMIVGGSGIAVELLIASLSMFLWLNLEPGAARAVAYNTMIVTGVSTLFFNGNPLLKFDGYYVLCDLLEIPNLGMRANRYLGYLAQRYLIRNEEAEYPISDKGEAGWLFVYGVSSFCYRLYITLRIALFVAGRFFLIGILIALWAIAGLLLGPLARAGRLIMANRALYKLRGRILAIFLITVGGLLLFATAISFPSFTTAEGILWPGDQSQLRSGAEGFIREIVAVPGNQVKPGQILIRCENSDLVFQVRLLEAERMELEARYRSAFVRDRNEERILKEEIAHIQEKIAEAREELAALDVRSPAAGILFLPQAGDMPGRFVKRGDALGYVIDYSKINVRVVIPQADVDRVRSNVRSVKLRLAEAPSVEIASELIREVPAASSNLPSFALSLQGGGAIALDPEAGNVPKSFENYFHFDLRMPVRTALRIGERVYVRFEHDPESLMRRGYRAIRHLFLRTFDI
ncbi:MAG: efflux RND transporter periplasmic adaptor subunit [Syntrophales bacterium]|jgi:putative peptide zinc metalloprotease protein|nr:efflux RND transporter periplasmic adaptor subunit [Syntrophales bacterium]